MIKHLANYLVKAACITIVFMLLFNCHDFHGNGRISEKELVEFLVDLHLANAIVSEQWNIDLTYQLDSASLHGSLFEKHGFTKSQFDTAMLNYSRNPEKLKALMDKVTARLKEMEQKAIVEKEQMKDADMEVVWIDSTEHRPRPGTMDKMDVDIPIRQAGMYNITVTVQLSPDDLSINPRMTLYFYRDDSTVEGQRIYFEEVFYGSQGGHPITYTATGMLGDSSFTHIRGKLINFNNEDSLFKRNIIISDFTVARKKTGLKSDVPLE